MSNPQSQSSEGNSQLDTTLGVLQGGLNNAIDIAGSNILGWVTTLRDVPQFASISTELQTLHDALASGKAAPEALAQSLATLGEHTTKAAAKATPDAQSKLLELGEALSQSASQLRG